MPVGLQILFQRLPRRRKYRHVEAMYQTDGPVCRDMRTHGLVARLHRRLHPRRTGHLHPGLRSMCGSMPSTFAPPLPGVRKSLQRMRSSLQAVPRRIPSNSVNTERYTPFTPPRQTFYGKIFLKIFKNIIKIIWKVRNSSLSLQRSFKVHFRLVVLG